MEVSWTRQGARGGGGLELAKARPRYHLLLPKSFLLQFFLDFFLFQLSPHLSILCWALDSTSLPLLSRSHDADDVADVGFGTISSPCIYTYKFHKLRKIYVIRKFRGGGGVSGLGSPESTASRNLPCKDILFKCAK